MNQILSFLLRYFILLFSRNAVCTIRRQVLPKNKNGCQREGVFSVNWQLAKMTLLTLKV